MISRQRCQLSFHGKLFNAFFVRHILPQIQGIDPTTQHGVSFLFQFLWKLDAIRILREIYSRGNKHHPTLLYVVILSNKNNARTPAAQLRCGFLIKELGAIFYISCIPIHFNPGKKKKQGQTSEAMSSWRYSSKWYSTSILSCRRTWATTPFSRGDVFFSSKSWVTWGIPNVVFIKDCEFGMKFIQDSSPVQIFGKPWG